MNSKLRWFLAAAACAPLIATAAPEPTGSAPATPQGMEAGHHPMLHSPMEGQMARGPQRGAPDAMGMGPEQHGGPGFAMGLPTPPWLMGIKLTEAQQDQIFKLVYDEVPQMREQMKTMHHVHEELVKLPFSEKFDAAQVKSLTSKLAEASAAIEISRVTTQNKIWKVLTPEQRKEISARMTHREGGKDMPQPPMAGKQHR